MLLGSVAVVTHRCFAYNARLSDFLRFLPFGVLHRLFTAPAKAWQTPGGDAGDAPASTPLLAEEGEDGAEGYHGGSQSILLGGTGGAQTAVPVRGSQRLPRNPLAQRCLDLLLVLLHNRRCLSHRCLSLRQFIS